MNTRIFVLVQCLLASSALFAQGTANFSYTVTNNHVTITELATCNCQYYWVSYNYGDTASGILNTNYYGFNGLNHYYRDPGTYTICAYLHNSGIGGCTCSDTFCQTVTITTQGTDCHAEYCYEMYLDTALNVNVINATNLSTADDSIITKIIWDFESLGYMGWDFYGATSTVVTNVPGPFLYIQTQSGCESAFIDTIFLGNTCDLTTTSHASLNNVPNVYAYPNPTKDKVYIGMNHIPQGAELLIINSLGQEVYRKQIVDTTKETEISLVGFSTGIYYLQVRTEGKVFSQKIIKE